MFDGRPVSYERLDVDLSTCYHGDGLGVAVGIAEYAPDINLTACRVQNRNLSENGNRSSISLRIESK